jgi:DNA excision repair protein ERCC-2
VAASNGSTDDYWRFFPYDEPYPNQAAAMTEIAEALDAERDVLLEGAPGTGKTLSALVPALDHARATDKTVVITTNVHQQMRQFVADARAITREEPIRAVVFKGKSSMCHIDVDYRECQTLRDTTRDLVETQAEAGELKARADALLDEMRDGGSGGGGSGAPSAGSGSASEAYEAVTEELSALESEIESFESANVCDHYRANLTRDTDAFFSWLFDDVRTPEDVYEYADSEGLCGYELLKEGMEGVDLVVCNYHHLLDPLIREQFFRWLGREPEDVVTVFDEAHNVESAARDHATRTLTENTLAAALSELEGVDDSRAGAAENVLGAFHDALRETYDEALAFGEREQVGENWYDLSVANPDRRDDLTLAFLDAYEGRGIATELDLAIQLGETLDEEYETAYKRGETTSREECRTLSAASFVATWMDEGGDLGQHPMVSVRRDAATEEVYGRAELYTAIPRAVTESLFGEVSATVLMSATLRPFDVTADVLGLDEETTTLAYGLAYPEANRRTLAVDVPPLFSAERSDPETQSVVAETLDDVLRFTPGNALVFFPSYAEAERYHERLRGAETELFLDGSDVDTERLRRRFVAGDDGALLTSLWGTLGEGVSFDGDDARTVAVVGVPYPQLSERMEAVQDAYDRAYSASDAGWRYGVEIPTIRKTRQALGRVIRSPDDYGVRLLLDRRYTAESRDMGRYGVRSAFPTEERAEFVDLRPEKVKFSMLNFFSDHEAYDGAPPRP